MNDVLMNYTGVPQCWKEGRTCKFINIEKQVPFNWAIPMYGYIMPIIASLTIATNSFIVVVLSHKYLRTPTNFVLLAMAVSELLTGVVCLPWFIYYFTLAGYKDDKDRGLPEFWCKAVPLLASFLPSVSHTMAIWLTVYLAIQRYIYICVPSLVRKFCTIRRSKQVILLICIVAPLVYTPEILSHRNESYELTDNYTHAKKRYCFRVRSTFIDGISDNSYYNVQYFIQIVFIHFIPCVLLVIFTWKLVHAIRVADKRHANLLNKYSAPNRSTRRKMSEATSSSDNENRLVRLFKQRESVSVSEPRRAQGLKQNTRMLVVVILLFLVTEIPAAIIFMMHAIAVSFRLSLFEYKNINKMIIIRNVLIVVSYPFRFAIYCGMSQQFRDVVRQMFTGKMATHPVRDKDNSTTLALVQGINEHSDDKRQSVVLCSTNGTLVSSIAEERVTKRDKAVQCDPSLNDECVPFDPFLSDLAVLHEAPGCPYRVKLSESRSHCSTQCSTDIDNQFFAKRKSSLLRAALVQNTQLSAVVAQVQ